MDLLLWLQKWYSENCDGGWEHFFGVKIDTLDNPGWRVEIDITDTPLEEKVFPEISYYNSDEDWLHCRISEGLFNGKVFDGSGDQTKLTVILETFRKWAEENA